MTPVTFPQANATFAKDQPEYLPLPVHRTKDRDGLIVSCWRLTWWERLKLLVTGRVWVLQLTFGEPLQPQCVQVKSPFLPAPDPQKA